MHFLVFVFIFIRSSSLIIMLATDVKMQKIEPDLNFFNDGQKFRRQSVNEIDTM